VTWWYESGFGDRKDEGMGRKRTKRRREKTHDSIHLYNRRVGPQHLMYNSIQIHHRILSLFSFIIFPFRSLIIPIPTRVKIRKLVIRRVR
jgi:hypothetical protein